jgi:pyruvate dehydrogenase E2 component (dihydrolipoyllysine-residue acetyltransferase)
LIELLMPKLSDSMSEGTVLRWLKRDGEAVTIGEELVEIETDKATVVFEAESAGVLRIIADEGQTLAIGAPIAQIGDLSAPVPAHREMTDRHAGETLSRPKASPVARRLAEALGVELQSLTATGPGGRIVKRDVEGAAGGASAPAASIPKLTTPAGTAAGDRGDGRPVQATGDGRPAQATGDPARGAIERLDLTPSQRTIARRMALTQSTMPAFTLTCDVEMEALLSFRGDSTGSEDIPMPSITDFVVKATALALRAHPEVNAGFVDEAI